MNLDEYADRLREIERAVQRGDRARGRLDELLRQVKKLFGTGDLDRAERELARMERELDQQARAFERAEHKWDTRYKRKLEEMS